MGFKSPGLRHQGSLAHLGERLNGIQKVAGSTPVGSTIMEAWPSGKASGSHPEDHGFDPRRLFHSMLQWRNWQTPTAQTRSSEGSTPSWSTIPRRRTVQVTTGPVKPQATPIRPRWVRVPRPAPFTGARPRAGHLLWEQAPGGFDPHAPDQQRGCRPAVGSLLAMQGTPVQIRSASPFTRV